MNKIKLGIIFLVAALFAVMVVQAEPDKRVQPIKTKPKAVAEIKSAPARLPQTSPLTGSRQGYQMVRDVLDAFGGESESDNYRIPVNSGGQPSAIGLSEGSSYGLEAGYVYASHVRRGDTNADETIDLGDIVYLLNYLFRGDVPPCPIEVGDVNCDGTIDLGDIVYLLNYLFKGGPAPSC